MLDDTVGPKIPQLILAQYRPRPSVPDVLYGSIKTAAFLYTDGLGLSPTDKQNSDIIW